MNKNVDIQMLKALYAAHKQYSVPAFIMLVSFFLIFFALIPQFQDLLITFSQRDEAAQKLQILKDNLNLLRTTDEVDLDSRLALSLRALSSEKDFESVLTTISSVANRSGVSVGNFEFKVGDLSGSTSGSDPLPSLGITLILNDGVNGASRFMANLAESLPLSEVKKVDVNTDFTTLSLVFYYKSLPITKIPLDARIPPISVKQSELLDKLLSWDNNVTLAPSVFPPDLTSPVAADEGFTTPF
ncbi:MAG: hypothetical protein WD967_02635 [Candidatus Levyibacteriota bacterium]